MAEFHPVRETLVIATAAIIAVALSYVFFRRGGPVDGFVLLVFLLFVFLVMTGYLLFRWLYGMGKDPS